MPCNDCGTPLLVSYEQKKLYCPKCASIPIVDPSDVQDTLDIVRERLSDEHVMTLIKEYDKNHLIIQLLDYLNRISHSFYKSPETPLSERDFTNIGYLLKLIFEREDFGDKVFEYEPCTLPEELELIIKREDIIFRTIDDIENGLQYLVPKPVTPSSPNSPLDRYQRYDSEHLYCFYRCMKSIAGGTESNMNDFLETTDRLRSFDLPSLEEVESVEDFANTFFEIIVILAFVMSQHQIVNQIYKTDFPPETHALDLQKLLNCLDSSYGPEALGFVDERATLTVTDPKVAHQCGKQTFGEDWEMLAPKLIQSKENPKAHPFLFKIRAESKDNELGESIEGTKIIYPRYYNRLIQFQIFPLLENGPDPSGVELLKGVNQQRADRYEINVYHDLEENSDYECFFSAWFTKSDQREIDLLVINDSKNELWFVEVKFILPVTGMRTRDGIERLNDKVHAKIFKEDTDTWPGEDGEAFDEKVQKWIDEKPGDTFISHEGPDGETRTRNEFREEWTELQLRKIVVSNVVPSYIEKRGVEFYTDVEFLQHIEGESVVFEKTN